MVEMEEGCRNVKRSERRTAKGRKIGMGWEGGRKGKERQGRVSQRKEERK